MKILITGSSGFVGKHLVKRLAKKHKVIKYDLVNGQNILDEKLLTKKLQEADMVIHLAAFISVAESWKKPLEYFRNNTLGTAAIVNSAIKSGVKKFIYFSSAAVKIKPLTPYSVSKISAEKILELYKKDIDIVTLRPENIYGPGQKESYGYVVHNFIKAAQFGKTIKIYGDGKQTRDFIYIDDVIDTIEKIIDMNLTSGTVISLGTGKETKIINLAKLVMRVVGKSTEIEFLKKRNEPAKSVANTKSLSLLHINTKKFISLEKGVKMLTHL